MGNKQVEKSVAIRDIPSVVCNNQGDQEVGIPMKEVVIVPDCAFDLLSISKRLMQGGNWVAIWRP